MSTTEENIKSVEFIYCACNCGKTRPKYDDRGRKYMFIQNHQSKGKKFTEEHRKNLKIAWLRRDQRGEKNSRWGKHHSEEQKKKWSIMRSGINSYNYGKVCSEETKLKISIANKGKCVGQDKHNWKGEAVGDRALHLYVRRWLPMPELCQICNEKSPQDLSNKTGIYNREFKNWWYLCHKCHLIFDNLIERNLRKKKRD